jgi:hypothetical protein
MIHIITANWEGSALVEIYAQPRGVARKIPTGQN